MLDCSMKTNAGSIGTLPPNNIQISSLLLDSITDLEKENQAQVKEEVQERMERDGSHDTDILFLGSGPAGYVGAIRAARMGARTVIVEKGSVGGTCLNVGCVPTKALLSTVEVLEHVKRAGEFGINVEGYSVDFPKIMDRKSKITDQLRRGLEFIFKKEKIQLTKGAGRLIDAHTVEVSYDDGKKEQITAQKIVIATGSVSSLIPLPGFEVGGAVWTSTEALETREVPKSLLIIGGGYIGLEFGYAFARLGAEVTVIEMLPQIVAGMDQEVAKELDKSLKKAGLKIINNAAVLGAEDTSAGKKVTYRDPEGREQTMEVEKVLLAVGRKPNTSDIGLEELGIKTERGSIIVDDRMRTNVSGVYAIGDCIGNPMLAHVAFHEGIVAVSNALGEEKHIDYRAVPGVVFTHPEVATVGLTEEKAREIHGDNVRIGKFPFIANGKALGMGEKEGFAKVIADAKYGEILGVHIIGPHATDMISEAVLAIQGEATIDDIEASIHPHPTLSEPLHEAALDTIGMALHKV